MLMTDPSRTQPGRSKKKAARFPDGKREALFASQAPTAPTVVIVERSSLTPGPIVEEIAARCR
jgi:hypothetical protein